MNWLKNNISYKSRQIVIPIVIIWLLAIFPVIHLMGNNHGVNERFLESKTVPILRQEINSNPYTSILEDLGLEPEDDIFASEEYDIIGKLRDNDNQYLQTWTPWLSKGAIHVAKMSEDGDFLVIGGGYLLDTELHIYRWNPVERQYVKVWEVGSRIITGDIYDVAFGDMDNNDLIEIAAASADGRVYLFEQAHISDPIANLENRFDYVWRSERFFQATSVEFADLDLDGIQDLIVGSWDQRIHIFEYTDHSNYPFSTEHWIELTEKWNSSLLDEKVQSLAVGDMNSNGLPDFVVGTISGSIYVFENDGVIMAPYGIEFPFPNDNNYRQIWTNAGVYQPIWHIIGQIDVGELDGVEGTDAVILSWGQGVWVLRYSDVRGFFLEQLIQDFESWQMQGAYPLDNFADWMVTEEGMNSNVYYQHSNGTKFPEPWIGVVQNEFDIFANSAVTGEPAQFIPPPHGGVMFRGNEYRYYPVLYNINMAHANCTASGGHLVTISDMEENDFVASLIPSGFAWTGLTDQAEEGQYKWITFTEKANFFNWNTLSSPNPDYEPDGENAPNADYIAMDKYGFWYDRLPTIIFSAFVCEWEGNPESMTPWSEYNGHRYVLTSQAKTWEDAKVDCESRGGHLVTISDSAENTFVNNLAQKGFANSILIGLTDSETYGGSEYSVNNPVGEWTWVTGGAATYTNWKTGQPNDALSADFAHMIYDGTWKTHNPNTSSFFYICEWDSYFDNNAYDQTHDSLATTFYTPGAPNRVVFNDHEYQLAINIKNFTDAKETCEQLGGHLVTIDSAAENDFISNLYPDVSPFYPGWIGFNIDEIDGNWQWITGENVTYTNWNTPIHPITSPLTNYTYMAINGTWISTNGTSLFAYICEWDSVTEWSELTATGTWNLGKGEELASNGNDDPDLYILLTSSTYVDPNEWVISLSNDLLNWYSVNTTDVSPMTNTSGLAVDVDPLFAVKRMMSAQYIRLTLVQGDSPAPKERLVNAIVHPFVARPLTIATAVTIEPLSFEYNETNIQDKIVFGGVDGRLLAFQYAPHNISYYRKFSDKPAELTNLSATDYGLVKQSFSQNWDSYTDDFWNLGETIWSIQGSPKESYIPSWRYVEGANTSDIPISSVHHLSVAEIAGGAGLEDYELIVSYVTTDTLSIYSPDGSSQGTKTNDIFGTINGYSDYNGKILTSVFGDFNQSTTGEEVIIFPWYRTFMNPEGVDLTLMPVLWRASGGYGALYNTDNIVDDVDSKLYNYLRYSTTYPSATAADMDNDSDIDLVLSNGRLAMLWNIGTVNSSMWKLDSNYFKELNEKSPPAPMFSPNAWDYDQDGDMDFAYSYGSMSGYHGIEYKGHEYQLITTPMTWEEANAYCEEQGGHLVTINSSDENVFVRNTFGGEEGFYERNAWIGLREILPATTPRTWEWVTEEPFNPISGDYENWYEDEPNQASKNYAALYSYHGFEVEHSKTENVWGWIFFPWPPFAWWVIIGTETTYWYTWDNTDELQNGYWIDQDGANQRWFICEWDEKDIRYGMDFFENQGTLSSPQWIRNAYLMKNPTTDGSLRFNEFTAGVIVPSDSYERSAEALWAYNPESFFLRKFMAEVDQQSSFILGTNPELLKLEVNVAQSPPDAVNYGYSVLKSWSNLDELSSWTMTLTTSPHLDGDNHSEIIVSDWDNNVYVFEHLAENTYKRAWQSYDLNHTEDTSYSPYAFQDLDGVFGDFRKTIYDHGNLLTTGLDYDKDGNEEFVLTAALTIYVFEATGYNDDYVLLFSKDCSEYITDSTVKEFTALAITPDYDGRGPMIAIAAKNLLFVLRSDPEVGWVESFQSITGEGYSGVPGSGLDQYMNLDIRTMLFADLNQDGNTELWLGGQNKTDQGSSGFLLALDSNYGDVHQVFEFPAISTVVNALDTVDADYDGNLELIIAHGQGLDIWEAKNDLDDLKFSLMTIVSSDPNYNQESESTPLLGSYQSPEGLAPRSNELLNLEGSDSYFSVYGLETTDHDISTNMETTMQNLDTGEGNLYYTITQDPENLTTAEPRLLTDWNLVITEVYYQNDSDPGETKYQWIEIYNHNPDLIDLAGWSLASSAGNLSLTGHLIFPNDFIVIAANATSFFDIYGAGITPVSYSFPLGLSDYLILKDGSSVIDYLSWGGVGRWNIFANGTSLERPAVTGYLESIIPLDTNKSSDFINTTFQGNPASGAYSYTTTTKGYEFRPVLTQNDAGVVTVAWVANYISPGSNFTRTVNIRQFDSTGLPLTSPIQIENITNSLGQTYYVHYEDIAILETADGSFLVAYVRNENQTSPLSGISGKISLMLFNTTTWAVRDLNANFKLDSSYNYKINSIELIEINDKVGVIFSGLPRQSSISDTQIYFTQLNSTYHEQSISVIMAGDGNFKFPDVSQQIDNPNFISVISEHQIGVKYELVSVFSSDGGISWSNLYPIVVNDPHLNQEATGLFTQNETNPPIPVLLRTLYNPRVTSDSTGGIYIQYSTRFLIPEDADTPNYYGNLVDYGGTPHHLVTQLWINHFENGSWFRYNDITNVRAIAVGDSDRDLRSEIFISHDYRVTLLEISQDQQGIITYVQKWQYEPPLFISLNPEVLNTTGDWLEYAQHLVDSSTRRRETGSVAIADTNGNGWPELIFTVLGGDVFCFELKNLDQPVNDIYLITGKVDETKIEFPAKATNLLITEVMYDSTNPEGNWVEIFNPTDLPIDLDLSSWTLNDMILSFSLSGIIPANSFYIMARNSTYFSLLHSFMPNLTWDLSMALDMNGDTLSLVNNAIIIDSVSWGSRADPQYRLEAQNCTIRRLNFYDTNTGADWEVSGTLGTPGSDLYYSLSHKITNSLLIDANSDGVLDLIAADSIYGNGLVAWNSTSESIIWYKPVIGEVYRLYTIADQSSNQTDKLLIAISSKGVLCLNLDGSEVYWISAHMITPTNHIFVDLDSDSNKELILASNNDVRAIQPLTGEVIWFNSTLDGRANGYFDLAVYDEGTNIIIGVSSSDFVTYRRINLLYGNGSLFNSFILSESHAESNLTSLFIFDTNSRTLLSDYDGNGELDVLLAILDNYDRMNPQSRIEVWDTERLAIIMNKTLPVANGTNLTNFQLLSYDINQDSIEDVIYTIPTFKSSTNGESGVFAIDIASKGSIIWKRLFSSPIMKLETVNLKKMNINLLSVFTENSGILTLSSGGSDIFWVEGDSSLSLDQSSDQKTKIWVTYENGTVDLVEVKGRLSSATNQIYELPYLAQGSVTPVYTANPFVIPVEVSNDGTEKLLVAYKNGTIILRTLEKELWKTLVEPFSQISATGLILDRQKGIYGFAFKTDFGNLLILDRTSTSVLINQVTEVQNITAINVGLNYDLLLTQKIVNNRSSFSLYDPSSQTFIWSKSIASKAIAWDSVAIDPLHPGIVTHIILLDSQGNTQLLELPTTTISGGYLPSPSSGGKWILIKVIENENLLSEIYLCSNRTQIAHYSCLSGSMASYFTAPYDLPLMNVYNWNIVKDSDYTRILLATESNGVLIYQENVSGMELVNTEVNYYIGSSDHQLVRIDESNVYELLLIVGSSLVSKEMATSEVNKIYSLTDMVKKIKIWNVDTTGVPVFVVELFDGTIAIADPIERLIGTGSTETSGLIEGALIPPPSVLEDDEQLIEKPNSIILVQILVISVIILFIFNIAKRYELRPVKRRIEK